MAPKKPTVSNTIVHSNSNQCFDNVFPRARNEDFKVNIPSVLLNNTLRGCSLASMSKEVLKKHLQSVVRSLRDLDAESLLGLERKSNGARLNDTINVRPIHEEVQPKYNSRRGISCVRYVHITEVKDQYSMGIFVFPPFSKIPLHDHPGMCVLSRLLYGDLQCLSLDLPTPDEEEGGSSSSSSSTEVDQPPLSSPRISSMQQTNHGLPEGARRAYKNHVSHLYAPDVSVLYPLEGNLHEFLAGPHGAAVLDILLPPYDTEHQRDCTFYNIQHEEDSSAFRYNPRFGDQRRGSAHMRHSALQGNEQDTNNSNNARTPCWIIPTGQPEDFHCISGKYGKIGTNVVHTQDL